MDLALSECLGQELQLAKRINSNGVIKLELWTKEVWKQILNLQKRIQVVLLDRGDHDEEVGVGFVGFGLTSKK